MINLKTHHKSITMKYKFLFSAFLFNTLLFSQSDIRIISLQDAVDIALEKNINIKQSELNLKNSELTKSDAIGNFLPNIGASANHQWNVGRGVNVTTNIIEEITTQFSSATASVGLPVYSGSRNVYQLHRANLEILASKYQLEDIKDDVKLFVANSYLQIMFNKEILKVQKSQLEITKEEYKRTKDLIESGIFSPRQIFEIEANLASQEQSVVLAENNLRDVKLNLAQVLLIDDYESFDIADEDFSIPFSDILENSPKEIFEKAKSFRNDIKLAETNLEIAIKDQQISKSALLPSASAFYSYNSRAVSYTHLTLPTINWV